MASVKYEELYLHEYADGHALHAGMTRCSEFYNDERPPQEHCPNSGGIARMPAGRPYLTPD